MKRKRLLPILILCAICIATSSCRHNTKSVEQKPVHIVYQTCFHTMDAKRDEINGTKGIIIYNDALQFNFDSTDIENFKEHGFTFQPTADIKNGEHTIWIKKENTFTQYAVRCGESDEDRTIITQGVKEGDEVVLGIDQIPVHQ